MFLCSVRSWLRYSLVSLVLLSSVWYVPAQNPEFRGFWVNGWNTGLKSATQVSALVNDVRAANANAIVAQVRRRGDAFYNSKYEPHVTGTTPSDFDALGDLISKAHNTSAGRYVEVHAWVVTYHIWSGATNATTPPQANHPLRLHPDWLLQDYDGNVFIGNQYTFDPGHPEVQKHTFNVCMDIITNYNVDGLNFDYIRYSSANEGYNPVTVARFNQRFGRTGKPSPSDGVWKQFRRDQITGFLRKVYLNAIAVRPGIKISCDTITWSPGPANLSAWYSSTAAWNNVLQDWRGWMEEGIMDLNLPMAYFDQSGNYTGAWTNWNNFIKDHQYTRQAAIGPGTYLNSIANAITQMRYTRVASPSGKRAVGVCGYDYNTPYKDGAGKFSTFRGYLTSSPNTYDPVSPAIFAQPASMPSMPWKTSPTMGHIKGTIYKGGLSQTLDGAVVRLQGPVSKVQTNDATGFYGFANVPPGNYTVSVSFPGYVPASYSVPVALGAVATRDFVLSLEQAPAIVSQPMSQSVRRGSNAVFSVTVTGSAPLGYQWKFLSSPIAGATSSAYTRTNVQPADAGGYVVTVTNTVGTVHSTAASLAVLLPGPALMEPIVNLDDGRSLLRWTADAGFVYTVQGSTNLLDWVDLALVGSATSAYEYLMEWPTNRTAAFYRVRD